MRRQCPACPDGNEEEIRELRRASRKRYAVHICGIPDGPYRYGGWYFEVHPYCGPSPLLKNGDPINRSPPRAFWKMWEVFDRLPQDEKDKYAAP